jgi:hypothetical protein
MKFLCSIRQNAVVLYSQITNGEKGFLASSERPTAREIKDEDGESTF